MKGGKYTKTLAKIQARRIFRIRDIRRNVLPKFIEICMETPCWCPPGWAPTWRTETNKNICYRVLVQKREFIPRGTHKHQSNAFSNCRKIPRNTSLFYPHDSFLGRHVNATSRKSLKIQACSITTPRTLCMKISLQLL